MDELEKGYSNESQPSVSTEPADEDESSVYDYHQYILKKMAEEPVIEIPEYEFEDDHEREVAEWTSYLLFTLRKEYPGENEFYYDYEQNYYSEYTLEELRDKFTELGALDVFLRFCLESCEEQLKVNKERLKKDLNDIDKRTQLVVEEENKKKPYKRKNIAGFIKNREKDKLKLIALREPTKKTLETQIVSLIKELTGMGFVGPDYKKKSVVTIKKTGIVNGKCGSTSKIINMMVNGGVIDSGMCK